MAVQTRRPISEYPLRRLILLVLGGAVLFFLLIQLIPYGRDHTNPPVRQEPRWANAQTRALAARACFDCHSNQTTWPWYSNIAPISWLTQHDVQDGRRALNFSDWGQSGEGAGDAAEQVRSGNMPPWYYVILHPRAKLSSAEKQALIRGLQGTH